MLLMRDARGKDFDPSPVCRVIVGGGDLPVPSPVRNPDGDGPVRSTVVRLAALRPFCFLRAARRLRRCGCFRRDCGEPGAAAGAYELSCRLCPRVGLPDVANMKTPHVANMKTPHVKGGFRSHLLQMVLECPFRCLWWDECLR